MAEIRILLADDHAVLRQGIAQVLESQPDMSVVAQAGDGKEAVKLALAEKPDVALVDINMPEMDGLEATRKINAENPDIRIIILTMYKRDDYIFEAIKGGASGYLLKEVEMDELLSAVRSVAAGEAALDPSIAAKVLSEFRGEKPPKKDSVPSDLAERDVEILQYVAKGMTNQEIASRLNITEKTVRNRLWNVYKQLHLKNRTEAALYAMREGLVDPPTE